MKIPEVSIKEGTAVLHRVNMEPEASQAPKPADRANLGTARTHSVNIPSHGQRTKPNAA
ncbi:hypothetical protein PC119_g17735 [Phytophthora cactorum]|nr:hypothetical protein PC117_g18050 [Phytophthora cactorum]KAG2997166.1 hypothetical protein PC119_g17735 [Phytophthora cactorum]